VIRTLRDFANQTLPRGPAEIFVPSATSWNRSPAARTARKAPPRSAKSVRRNSKVDEQVMGKLLLVGCGKMAVPCWTAG